MKRFLYLILASAMFCSACYNYDGPTRPKRQRIAPAIVPISPVQKITGQQYLEEMAGEISKALPSAQVKILKDSIKVLFPDNIRYSNSAILPEYNINSEINRLAELIIKYDKTHVLVTGHTDQNGQEQQNKKISQMRAQYIVDLLLAYKVPNEQLSAWGLGSLSPLQNGRSDANRRVEFVVLSTIEKDKKG